MDPGAFLARIAGVEQADSLRQLLMLHAVQQRVLGPEAEPLEEFMQWAPALLRDMSEIDGHLLEPATVYRDLRQYHELDAWSFLGSDPLSAGQLRTIEQWRRMGELQAAFAEELSARGLGSAGSIAKAAAALVSATDWRSPWSAIHIAGLNALEPAITRVIGTLMQRGLADIAWDADHHYLDDTGHEAGRFLRRSIGQLGSGTVPPGRAIEARHRHIDAVGVSDAAAMARYAAEWAMALDASARQQAVIVLADETMLMPVLEALPAEIGPLNVTMGVPLRSLPVHGLESRFLALVLARSDQRSWPVDRLKPLLSHPMLHEGEATRTLIATLPRGHVGTDALVRLAAEAGSRATAPMEQALRARGDSDSLPPRMRSLLAWAAKVKEQDPFAREQLYQLARVAHELDQVLESHGHGTTGPEAYAALRERAMRDARLTLFGEPLAGLQVMGLLETRALDHKHVLLLGANEGLLGGGDPPASWIPFDLRRHYGLPLHADADAVLSYHVHRLLHAAEHVDLVHVSGGQQDKGPSRFIAQWKHSLAAYPGTVLRTRARTAPIASKPRAAIAVHKTPEVLDRLREHAATGLSPSALATWLSCPLDFHARYVLGLRVEEEDSQRLAPNVLGEALHAVMEETLRPTLGQPLRPEILRNAARTTDQLMLDRLRAQGLTDDQLRTGHHRLVASMASTAMRRYWEAEAARCARERTVVMALEENLSASISSTVRLIGKSDRLETRDGLLHVLDLKTGRVDPNLLRLDALDRSAVSREHGPAIQLMCYAIMAFERDPSLQQLRAGLIPLRTPSAGDGVWLRLAGEDRVSREKLDDMRSLIATLIHEILDPDVPFRHDPESTYCHACVGP